jgi:hypothetical protein
VLITIALMSATLFSLAHISQRLFDAQQSQFAADASALACVLAEQDLALATAEDIAQQNFANIVRAEKDADKCIIVAEANRVLRRAVAVSIEGFDLPTLQR